MKQDNVRYAGNLGHFELRTRIGDVTDDAVHADMTEGDGGFDGGISARGNSAFEPECRFAGEEGGEITHADQLAATALPNS